MRSKAVGEEVGAVEMPLKAGMCRSVGVGGRCSRVWGWWPVF
jgi:hypothetical protein